MYLKLKFLFLVALLLGASMTSPVFAQEGPTRDPLQAETHSTGDYTPGTYYGERGGPPQGGTDVDYAPVGVDTDYSPVQVDPVPPSPKPATSAPAPVTIEQPGGWRSPAASSRNTKRWRRVSPPSCAAASGA